MVGLRAIHMGTAIHRKIPFKAKIAFMPRGRVSRNDRNEQRAFLDLAPDLLIPNVPAAQFALIEPHLNSSGSQCLAYGFGSLRVL